ncbi:MAG TPA: AgmX/PglI C-terminal domain-containing protein, partial [Polyangiaceae bacterium]|nr:AgmX/PglI C-terminal domain-containing protein [Polyangiaceae bacterium]
SVVELRRDESQLKAAPTAGSERKVQKLSEAYAWLHATCGKEPCAGVILVLSPEQTNRVIASALQAISTPNAPTPLFDLRKENGGDSNELASFGRLPPEEVQEIVRNAHQDVMKCYEDGLGRNAKLKGRVSVKFVIDIDGSVKSSTLAPSDMPDAEVSRCIVGRFAKLHFPRPQGGILTVVYPMMFKPD